MYWLFLSHINMKLLHRYSYISLVLWGQHLQDNTIIETTFLRLLSRRQLKYCYTLQLTPGKRVYTRLHGFGGLNDRDGRDKIYKPYRSKKKDFYWSSEESSGNINDQECEQWLLKITYLYPFYFMSVRERNHVEYQLYLNFRIEYNFSFSVLILYIFI